MYLRFDVLLAVTGTSQVFNEVVPVAPDPPQLVLSAPPRLSLGAEAKATVTFTNPLPVKMENVSLTIESDQLLHGGEGRGGRGGERGVGRGGKGTGGWREGSVSMVWYWGVVLLCGHMSPLSVQRTLRM